MLCSVCIPGAGDCCVALPGGATGLSAVCDCGISRSYLLTIVEKNESSEILRQVQPGISSGPTWYNNCH